MRRSMRSRRRTPPARWTRSAFDSVPGSGFDTSPMAAAIVPPRGAVHRHRRAPVDQSAGDQRVPRDQRRLEGECARSAARGDRYVISGLTERAIAESGDVAGDCRRMRRRARRIRSGSRGSACSSRPTAWMPAGRSGCSSGTASSSPASPPPTSRGTLKDRIDVLVVADEARGSCPGAASGARLRAAPGATTSRASRRWTRFVRAGGTLVALSARRRAAIDQLKLPVRERAQTASTASSSSPAAR